MTIIILDLEWNTAYYSRESRFINEIIEFGAVKLDENFDVVDDFQKFVRSRLTKRLRGKVKELTHITNDDLIRDGEDFADVLDMFTKWAGKDSLIMTWSNTDLHVLVDNCKSFVGSDTIPFLYYYADLQKYVQSFLDIDESAQLGLSHAADLLGSYSGDIDFHRAKGDSFLCARIFKQCYDAERFDDYIFNTRGTDFYDRLAFKNYIISEVGDENIEPGDLKFKCPGCDGNVRKTSKWKFKNRYFVADFFCKSCQKKFVGKVQVKRLYDGVAIKKTIVEAKSKQKQPQGKPEDLRNGAQNKSRDGSNKNFREKPNNK